MYIYYRIVCLLLCLLITPLRPVAQEIDRSSKESSVSVDYDKFRNETTVAASALPTSATHESSGLPTIFITVGFSYRGKKLKAQPRTMFVTVNSLLGFMVFERLNSFIALVDGKRVRLKQLERTYTGPRRESLSGEIPYQTFLRIANAKKVEMQVEHIDFELLDESLMALRELAARSKP